MIVMKFGGTSVKDADAADRVAAIIKGRLDRKPVIVVSAFGKTTDALVSVLDALSRSQGVEAREQAAGIERHHREIIDTIIPGGQENIQTVQTLQAGMVRLNRLIDGMECLGEVSLRSRDAVLSFGELTAAPLLASFLAYRGIAAVAVDPREIMVTDENYGRASPKIELTVERCLRVIAPLVDRGMVPVMGGYVGASETGVITTLGRGGSDLTASLVAKALDASALEFWKDVDGILSADPRLVPEARPLLEISFQEAVELAFLGAKVLHPASIQPAVEAGVPVRVLNSYQPGSKGTLISKMNLQDETPPGKPQKAISSVACKRNQVLVNVYSTRMIGASGFLRRVFEVFDRLNISVDHIATSEVNVTVTMDPTERLDDLKISLGEVAKIEICPKVGIVSLVGRHIPRTPGVAAWAFGALKGINIRLITYGGFGANLSLVVSDEDVPRAVQSLHSELCLHIC